MRARIGGAMGRMASAVGRAVNRLRGRGGATAAGVAPAATAAGGEARSMETGAGNLTRGG